MTTYTEIDMFNHEHYKQYLTFKSKTAKTELDKLKSRISRERKRIKKIIEKHESLVNELTNVSKKYKKDIKLVTDEYSFRRKLNNILKKHLYLCVDWEGDFDRYYTWVYSEDFDGGNSHFEGDPFQDNHFCDSYEEAYERALDYIKLHEANF